MLLLECEEVYKLIEKVINVFMKWFPLLLLEGVVEVVGSSVFIWMVVLLLMSVLRYVMRRQHLVQEENWRHDLFYVCVVSLVCITIRELGFDHYVHHTEAIKVSILFILSAILLYIDAKRYTNNFTLKDYLISVGQAFAYSILVLPLAAILISVIFLIITSLLTKLGGDPEHSTLINELIYYGVLYGPMYVIYWHAKRSLIKKPNLPW